MTSSHHVSIDFSWGDSFYELPCSDDLESIEDNLSGIFYNFFEFSFFFIFKLGLWVWGRQVTEVKSCSVISCPYCHISIDCAHLAEAVPFRFPCVSHI